jgi:hypothetical protein
MNPADTVSTQGGGKGSRVPLKFFNCTHLIGWYVVDFGRMRYAAFASLTNIA